VPVRERVPVREWLPAPEQVEHVPRHRRGAHRRGAKLGPGPAVAMVIHVIAAFTLMPVAGHPYDLAALTSASGAWLRWGVPLFYHWKFGFDLSVLGIGSQSLSYVLEHLGMSGAAALAAAWKLPLVLADLLVGAILVDLGWRLRCPRPGLIATLWLISPVSLWVSAGHGQIESLTILAIVLSLDMLIRRRPLLAGIVVGLGIGIEYIPVMVALIVVFWLYASAIGRREVCHFVAGCVGALALCFGPPLASDLGRTSLLGGLTFTASVASHPGHTQATSVSSSLWAIFDLSPGQLWLFTALLASAALMIVLARKARSADRVDPHRLGVLATGGLLLCLTLFDPGALPQFSVLVLAGLCLVGLCVDLSPAAIILGPLLQLAAGFFYVYGGSFQSFWYDMWVTTGIDGWPFPQSVEFQAWAARLGAVVITFGLLAVPSRMLSASVSARLRIGLIRSAIIAGVLGTAFLAVWSLQPAFWQGVGSHGPPTLADFNAITATQPGEISTTPNGTLITFASSSVLAERESAVSPSLMLSVNAHPFFAQTEANSARFGRGLRQTLTIPGWKREKKQVNSLWVSTLIGRPTWRTQADVVNDVPALVVYGTPVSSGEANWVAPGWAVITYSIPSSLVSAGGQLRIGLQQSRQNRNVVEWNGNSHVRWVLVSLHSGAAMATINGKRWHGSVTLQSPTPSWWFQRTEAASIQGIALQPRPNFRIMGVVIGGQQVSVTAGSFTWPSRDGPTGIIPAPLLAALGVIDVVGMLGSALLVGRWTTRIRARHVSRGLRVGN
jgi:hypothetical protein